MINSIAQLDKIFVEENSKPDNADKERFLKECTYNFDRDSTAVSFQQLFGLLNQVKQNINISIFVVMSGSEKSSSLPANLQGNAKQMISKLNIDYDNKSFQLNNNYPEIQRSASTGQISSQFSQDELRDYLAPKQNKLTQRETEILHYIAKGYLNKQIANTFSVSEQTVKNQVTSILRKLNVDSRTGAVATAVTKGIISFSEMAMA